MDISFLKLSAASFLTIGFCLSAAPASGSEGTELGKKANEPKSLALVQNFDCYPGYQVPNTTSFTVPVCGLSMTGTRVASDAARNSYTLQLTENGQPVQLKAYWPSYFSRYCYMRIQKPADVSIVSQGGGGVSNVTATAATVTIDQNNSTFGFAVYGPANPRITSISRVYCP
jgi:hypothetical protein